MDIIDVFPTALGQFRLDGGFLPDELSYILSAERRANIGNLASVDSHILERPELHRIKAFISGCVDQYFQVVYAPTDAVKLHITQSWVNFTEKGEHQPRHLHQNSFISGVIYVQTSNGQDNITFYKTNHLPWDISNTHFNGWNSEGYRHTAVTATLLIFPSTLEHMVENVVSDTTRVSLAFNTFFSGTLGSAERFTELVLPPPTQNK